MPIIGSNQLLNEQMAELICIELKIALALRWYLRFKNSSRLTAWSLRMNIDHMAISGPLATITQQLITVQENTSAGVLLQV
jgi:hypothetical protein